VCNRSAHCEGINGRQPHNLSTILLLAAPTRSAHGIAGAKGSVRHKRVRCNSDRFRGVRPDPDETPDDRKLTGFDDFGPSDQVIDLMADRLADGPTGLSA
jgi:hypothetical protein